MQHLKKSLFVSIFATDEVCPQTLTSVSSTLFVQKIGRGRENFLVMSSNPTDNRRRHQHIAIQKMFKKRPKIEARGSIPGLVASISHIRLKYRSRNQKPHGIAHEYICMERQINRYSYI